MPGHELPPSRRSRPLGFGRSGENGDAVPDPDARTRLLGTFSLPAAQLPRGSSSAPVELPKASVREPRKSSWRRAAALVVAACAFVGLGFALGSVLKRQAPKPGEGSNALKIGPASAGDVNASASAAAMGTASPVCATPASSAKLVATTGKKAPQSAPTRVEAPPRAEASKHILSPVRDPGF